MWVTDVNALLPLNEIGSVGDTRTLQETVRGDQKPALFAQKANQGISRRSFLNATKVKASRIRIFLAASKLRGSCYNFDFTSLFIEQAIKVKGSIVSSVLHINTEDVVYDSGDNMLCDLKADHSVFAQKRREIP